MTISYWEKQTYFNNVNLLVIGSGIVGLNAAIAYKTKFPKAKVLVAERGILPNGASTKNAGFCCFGSVSELADDLTHIKDDVVFNTVLLRFKGLKKLRNLLGDDIINYQQLGGFEVFDSKKEFEACADVISSFNKKMKDVVGLKNVYEIDKNKITKSGFSGFKYCIKNNYEGQINTGQMMQALLSIAYKKGIIILNNMEVDKISDSKKEVETFFKNNLSIKSKKVIIATNGFAKQLLPTLDVKPARAQVLVTEPIKNLKVEGTFHYQQGYYYFRNIDNRILFGGGRNLDLKGEETTEMLLTKTIQNKLEEILKEKILPKQKFKIDQRWSGIMGVGSEKKPIIKHTSKNVVCAVRMGGMGVAIGSLVGQLAVDELLKKG
ncbi:MAG TPA: FAD-dependent oxidoreductase [Bacteroidia bacterium]|jgi:gamma-glutamylputrescine oxidase|nr:FAD-dependent oxidoreductase [Bacteroidia bacterium]